MCCYNKFYTKELIGANLTLQANNYHSVTIMATLGNPRLTVLGSNIIDLSAGMVITMTATELIENSILIECATSGDKAIIIYNN